MDPSVLRLETSIMRGSNDDRKRITQFDANQGPRRESVDKGVNQTELSSKKAYCDALHYPKAVTRTPLVI